MMPQQGERRLTIREMCAWAEVSRASYHRWHEASAPREAELMLREAMQEQCLAHRFYGRRRIRALLVREGFVVSERRVGHLMGEDNLLCVRRGKFVLATTDSDHAYGIYPNLAPFFQVTGIHQLWVADITYVRLREEFVYLAVVLDVYSRRAIGWSVGRNLTAEVALQALRQALADRPPPQMHHSDRGAQYACQAYVELLAAAKITISMSRPARPWDNAYCESFIKTLKAEQLDGSKFARLEDFAPHLPRFLDESYNEERLHSALGYRSPAEFERALAAAAPLPPPAKTKPPGGGVK